MRPFPQCEYHCRILKQIILTYDSLPWNLFSLINCEKTHVYVEMNKIIHTTIIADQLHVTTIVYATWFLQLAPNWHIQEEKI